MEHKLTRQEAKQNGFNLITNWQLFWLIISFVFFAGGSFAVSQYRISKNESDIKKIQTWQEKRIIEIQEDVRKKDEIIINLKALVEHAGLTYQTAQ